MHEGRWCGHEQSGVGQRPGPSHVRRQPGHLDLPDEHAPLTDRRLQPETLDYHRDQHGQFTGQAGRVAGHGYRDVEVAQVVVDGTTAARAAQHGHAGPSARRVVHLTGHPLATAQHDAGRVLPYPEQRTRRPCPDQGFFKRQVRRLVTRL